MSETTVSQNPAYREVAQEVDAQNVQSQVELPVEELQPDTGLRPMFIAADKLAVYRVNWPDPVRGRGHFKVTGGGITSRSAVFVSISEMDGANNRYLGDAVYVVENIAPRNGYVEFYATVHYGSHLLVAFDLLVINP